MVMRQSAEQEARYRARILCIDPEPRVPDWFPAALRQVGYLVETMDSAQVLLDPAQLQEFDLIIIDLSLSGQDGLSLLRALAQPRHSPPVIVIADRETMLREEELIKAGAYDIVLKPVSQVVLQHVLERTLSHGMMRRELEYLRSQWAQPLFGRSIGISNAWSKVLAMIERAAATDAPVLFVGEAGLGKGDAARLLHSLSPRSKGPFVSVTCARLSQDLFARENFTRRAKARSGADSEGDLYFHIAHGGTLFLDEIGLMPASAQKQLLQLMEQGSVPVESERLSSTVDVRLVASSTGELGAEVSAGTFSRGLFERFAATTIAIPPLRERREDIPLLAAAFLERCAARMRKNVTSFTPEAMALLESYNWPGNVQELRNVIERAAVLAESSEITASCLRLHEYAATSADPNRQLNLRAVLAAEEKKTLVEALLRAHGVRREAARLLGIDPRNLVYFLRKYGLDKKGRRG